MFDIIITFVESMFKGVKCPYLFTKSSLVRTIASRRSWDCKHGYRLDRRMRRQRNADATCKGGTNEIDMSLAQNPTAYHLEFIENIDRFFLFKWN